ncbi:MAG: ferredoxin reductase family protein [Patescibacteria group bacterium]
MKKVLFLGLFIVNLIIILYFWFDRSGSLLSFGQTGLIIALGRIFGLLAVYLVLWQLVLIGRIKFIEKVFGHDKLAIVHHINGLISWIFIFLHPLFIILGYKLANEVSFWQQTNEFLFHWEGMLGAILAVIIFMVVIVTSVIAIKKKLRYETWYFIHLFTYLAIILAFNHQLEFGNTLQNQVFYIYWQVLYWVVIGLFIYFKFFVPGRLFFKHQFYISKIEKENESVVSIYISGNQMESFNFLAGQFATFRFLDGRIALEAHPFSFSQAKNNRDIRISIKGLGDFTSVTLNKLKIGTKVFIDGPHGIFTSSRTNNKKIALIAGGVGITPMVSIAESAQEKDIVILYSVALKKDFIFNNSLAALKNVSALHLIASQDNSWDGEKGRLDKEKIKRLVPDYLERSFYLCGPAMFMKNIIKLLIILGVNKKNIYFEKFSLG